MMARWALLLGILAAAPAGLAQIDQRLSLDGAVDVYAGLQLAADPDFLAARTRAEAGLAFDYDGGRIVARARLTHDALTDQLRTDLREAFAEVFLGPVDLRVGHQLIVWGRADGVFVTDLLAPLDLSEFVAQPVEDLRLPLTAAVATLFAGDLEVAAVLVPRHPTTRLPEPGTAWFPAPERVLGLPIVLREPEATGDVSIGRSEVALRATWRGLPRTDVALLWINGFNRVPALRRGVEVELQPVRGRITLTPVYERRHALGMSAETAHLDPFIIRGEAAYHSRYLLDQPIIVPTTIAGLTDPEFLDAAGRGFLLAKPYAEAVVAVERTISSQRFSVQAIGRWVIDHDERVAADAFEPALSLLWLGRFLRDTLRLRLFALYNIDRDYWVYPEVAYAVQDGLNVSLGAHLFGGRGPEREDLESLLREPSFRYSIFRENRFSYVRLSYRF